MNINFLNILFDILIEDKMKKTGKNKKEKKRDVLKKHFFGNKNAQYFPTNIEVLIKKLGAVGFNGRQIKFAPEIFFYYVFYFYLKNGFYELLCL